MEEVFAMSVEEGLKLAKRVYSGKERHTASSPRQPTGMERSRASLLPTAPIVYAVIGDPVIVDNPDVPSYQPHVYGRCDPPVLIPLQMKEMSMKVDCFLDTVFVVVRGRWRVHCVKGSRKCDCRLLVPMGEQGSILGVKVNYARSYSTEVVHREDYQNTEKFLKNERRVFSNPSMFSLTIPQVDGGCDISLQVTWLQKMLYKSGHFSIIIPFTFPEYVTPFANIVAKRETIQLNLNTGTEKEVIMQKTTHALKEKGRHVGRFSFLYEADVEYWSTKDFEFSYSVFSGDPYGGILLKSPVMHDHDQRNMFCLYLYPGNNHIKKVFSKQVVFLVDISESLEGKPLEGVKSSLLSALSELAPTDYFNIIAFNEEMHFFSSTLKPANLDMLENAANWISKYLVACGGTNIMRPLKESMGLFFNTKDSVPYIFLITDGAVEDERAICHAAKTYTENKDYVSPRICTFGIGSYCNHYFLQMLSSLGRGQNGAAFDPDSIAPEMQKWFRKALFPIVTNIAVDAFDNFGACEVYPCKIPDLLVECPLIISGRYEGKFPSIVKAEGNLADRNNIVINLKVQNSEDIPVEKIFAKQQIDLLTAQAWLSQSKQLEENAAKLSIQWGIPSEYTYMIFQIEASEQEGLKQKHDEERLDKHKNQVATLVHHVTPGFGNLIATVENLPPGCEAPKQPDTFAMLDKAVSCCSGFCDCCCCVYCIQMCSKLSNQCVIALTQLCTALSCFACSECCVQLCCDDN